ncbi:MAG: hypothetical protein GC187_07425 [Alphaproteobacteria bacterium]|nr:hypothetical protein [Alphaproteobacteria bacterium]
MSLIATLLAALSLLSASDTADLQHAAAALEAEANARAQLMAATPGAPARALNAGDPVLDGLDALSLAAARHASAIDAAGGARDLACIFRGLSADAAAWPEQLAGMDRAADQARAYREIARLANHAARLAQEDIRSAPPA